MPPKKGKFFETTVVVRDVQVRYGEGYSLTQRPKKKKVKKYDDVMPTGIDDGKGAQKLLNSYVKEVFGTKQQPPHTTVQWESFTDNFTNSNFVDQSKHLQLKNMPLKSQVARQQALVAYQPHEKKVLYIDLSKRLKRDDCFLIRARLSHEGMDDESLKLLAHAMTRNTRLQHLMLHDNKITDAGIKELCLALHWHPSIHTIWLGLNKITDIGARHIGKLMKYSQSLRELNLANKCPSEVWHQNEFELHPHISYIGAQYLASQLNKGCGLTSLNLVNQRIRDDGAIYIFKTLKNSSLRVLNIAGNDVSDRCCEELRTALELNPVLEKIVLSNNGIEDNGGINLAHGFAENTVLRVCDLGHNKIGNRGLDALYLCLQYNTTLTSLITINNAADPDDDRAEQLVANRSSVFGFANINSMRLPKNGSSSQQLSYSSAGEGSSIGSRPSHVGAKLHRNSIEVPAVEMLGKSILSRSYRNLADDDSLSQVSAFIAHGGSCDGGGAGGGVGYSGSRRRADSVSSVNSAGSADSSRLSNGSIADSDKRKLVELPSPGRSNSVAIRATGSSTANSSFHSDSTGDADVDGGASGELGQAASLPGAGTGAGVTESGQRDGGSGTTRRASDANVTCRDHIDTRSLEIPALPLPTIAGATTTTTARDGDGGGKGVSLEVGSISAKLGRPVTPPAPMLGGGKSKRQLARQNSTSNGSGGKQNSFLNRFVNNSKNSARNLSFHQHHQHQPLSTATSRQASAADLLEAKESKAGYVYKGPPRKSRDLGKTTGVPNIQNVGVRPVRTSVTQHRDSAQLMLYLRVSTPYDEPEDRPYPLVNIGRDREDAIAKQRAERQTEKYKYDKAYLIKNLPKRVVHQAALPKVPDYFWDAWKKKIRLQYKEGIDNAPGCVSTKLEPLKSPPTRPLGSIYSTDAAEEASEGLVDRRSSSSSSKVASLSHRSVTKDEGRQAVETLRASSGSTKHSVSAGVRKGQQQEDGEPLKSGYDLAQLDPSQAFRRHLPNRSGKGVSPGAILAARRKENRLQREEADRQQRMLDAKAGRKPAPNVNPLLL